MKASILTAILTFTATVFAVPTSKNYPPSTSETTTASRSLFGKRDAAQALTDCQSNPNPQQCIQVVTAIVDWDNSVNLVNAFLNGDSTSAADTLTVADREPGFLASLQATPNLSQAGLNAANTLGGPQGVFPQVPSNLLLLLDGSGTSVQTVVDNINGVRCAQILGAISTLWLEAATAANLVNLPGGALGPNFCPKRTGNVNDAFN